MQHWSGPQILVNSRGLTFAKDNYVKMNSLLNFQEQHSCAFKILPGLSFLYNCLWANVNRLPFTLIPLLFTPWKKMSEWHGVRHGLHGNSPGVSTFGYGSTRESIVPWHMSLVMSAKVRRSLSQNEHLWHTINIGNVFEPTSSLKNSQYLEFKK